MRFTNPAQRRYLRRFVPLMSSYVLILFVANRLIEHRHLGSAMVALLAALPAVPLAGVMLVMGLYLRDEQDEYLRVQQVTAMLAGTAICLAAITFWGFLELNGVVGHPPTFLVFPFWCGCFGLVHALLALRDRATGAAR